MNLPIDREFLTQAVVAFGACLGGWMMLVDPKVDQLHELEAAIQQGRARSAEMSHAAIEKIANQAPTLRARSSEIESKSRLSRDSALLYGRIMDLATGHGVEVKNLQPRVERSGGGEQTAVTKIDITVEGDYEQLASLLQSLDEIDAYIRQSAVQLTPTQRGERPTALMQLTCDALSFPLPEAVVRMKGAGGNG
jgi:type II secretory pathway component PulM